MTTDQGTVNDLLDDLGAWVRRDRSLMFVGTIDGGFYVCSKGDSGVRHGYGSTVEAAIRSALTEDHDAVTKRMLSPCPQARNHD